MKDNNRQNLFSEIEEIPDVLKESHLLSLDGLRAVSVIFVLVFHVLMSFKTRFSFDYLANLGVQFFFVISGFLITTLLLKEKVSKGSISLGNFYVRRFFRIIPVAYLYLSIVLLLDIVFKLHLKLIYLLTSFLFIRNFFETATGIDHLSTHYWSLSVEEQFYLIFPFILKRSFRVYLVFLSGIMAFSFLLDFLGFGFGISLETGAWMKFLVQIITQFQGITIGSLTSIILFKTNSSFNIENKTMINLGLFVTIILLTLYPATCFFNLIMILKCALFAMILVINLNPAGNVIFKALNSNAMKLIGVLSFSIYIWQQPFTQGLNIINQTSIMKHFENKVPIDIVITIASLMVLSVISYVSYYYYERKFLKLRERFR